MKEKEAIEEITPTEEVTESITPPAAAEGEPPVAAPAPLGAAWQSFLSAISAEDRAKLLAVLSRLAEGERARRLRAEEDALLAEMEKEPAFAGITSRRKQMQALVAEISWLAALPTRERLAAAFYLDRGMRYHEPTKEEKLSALLSDPALLRAFAERQAILAAEARERVAPIARGGRMPADLPKPPRNLAEAGAAAKRVFRVE
ncbi:MAG: hypothetical protein IJ012_05280 [Clostridia bacterium]|nr:hypothetical protein [Clostridia bacterium]